MTVRTQAQRKKDRPSRPVDLIIRKFEEEAVRIQSRYQQRKVDEADTRARGGYLRPWDTAENYLKREAYALIARTLDLTSGASAIKKMVRRDKNEPNAPSFRDNPFYWGLLALNPFELEKHPKMKISLYAPLLRYAYEHRVPPPYLIGFLFQSGRPADIRRKNAAQEMHQEFIDELEGWRCDWLWGRGC